MEKKNLNQKSKKRNLKFISEYYGIPLATLRRYASEQRFPLYRVSNRIFVDEYEFDEWFETYHIEGRSQF